MEEHYRKKIPTAFICTNLIIFSLFLMYFFALSQSVSLVLPTMISIKIPNQNFSRIQKTPFLCYPLTICTANSTILHLGSTSLDQYKQLGEWFKNSSFFISNSYTGSLRVLESISRGTVGWAERVAEIAH